MIYKRRSKPSNLPTLIIHIGTEKTGTTSIQEFVHANRRELLRQQLQTIQGFGSRNNREFVSYFQNSLDDWARQKDIRTLEGKAKYFSNFRTRFENEILLDSSGNRSSYLLITSEHLSSRLRTSKELHSLKEFLEQYFSSIKIIAYFRPQEEMALSLYSTGLKGQVHLSLEDWLLRVRPDSLYYNFYAIAQLWASVFGKENLHLRVFDRRKLVRQDIRRDFLEALKNVGVEIHPNKLSFGSRPANESLTNLQGSVFASINETVPYWNREPLTGINRENVKLKRAAMNISELSVGRYQVKRPGEVQARFEDANKNFFDEFLPGQFFELQRPNEAEESMPLSEVEQLVRELTKTLLAQKVNTIGPALLDSDADYLRDIAVGILDKRPLSQSEAEKLLELALRVRPDGALIKKQLERAKRGSKPE